MRIFYLLLIVIILLPCNQALAKKELDFDKKYNKGKLINELDRSIEAVKDLSILNKMGEVDKKALQKLEVYQKLLELRGALDEIDFID